MSRAAPKEQPPRASESKSAESAEPKVGQSCALLVEVSEDGAMWKATLLTKAGKKTNGWKRRDRFYADLNLLKSEFGRFVLQGIGRPHIG